MKGLLVALVTFAAGAGMAREALAFTCINRTDLAAIMDVSGAALMDEFIDADGEAAIKALNGFTLPGTMHAGEQLLFWRTGGLVTATVMLWRGGGYCLVSQTMLTTWQADAIRAIVLGQ